MNEEFRDRREPVVLVVDDDEGLVDLYAESLKPDFEVITAHNGEEALEKVDSDVDIVLLDRRMPDLHGDEVLAEIRSRDIDCRVVMVTAVDPDVDVVSLDFDDYLVKPVSTDALRETVERMLSRDELDSVLVEAFALASKMATLESKMEIEELENSEEYAALEDEFLRYRELVEDIKPDEDLYAKLSTTKLHALFGDE